MQKIKCYHVNLNEEQFNEIDISIQKIQNRSNLPKKEKLIMDNEEKKRNQNREPNEREIIYISKY